MTIKLNHTIVHSRDPRAGADFLAGLFGLPAPKPFGPFLCVEVGVYSQDPSGHLLEIITRP
jgi:hypothetical protein